MWCAVAARWPGLWLYVVPAALPLANLTPWTGWLAFEEFDLLLFGVIVAGHARLACETVDKRACRPVPPASFQTLMPGRASRIVPWATIASAVLDRLLHHADTILIEAPSYRMKDQAGE